MPLKHLGSVVQSSNSQEDSLNVAGPIIMNYNRQKNLRSILFTSSYRIVEQRIFWRRGITQPRLVKVLEIRIYLEM